MSWKMKVDKWLENLKEDNPLKQELLAIQENDQELKDFFHKDLELKADGMTEKVGPGPNRMNIYTVRKAAVGLAEFIYEKGKDEMQRGIVIAYDSRQMSFTFALEAAKTIGHYGIKTYLFKTLRPTPVLSFAIRHLHAYAGIAITASDYPREYNGLKVYGQDGAQLFGEEMDQVVTYSKRIGSALDVKVCSEKELIDQGLLTYLGENIDKPYADKLKTLQMNENEVNAKLNIVFTPLHGTSGTLIRRLLRHYGFDHLHVVEEQDITYDNLSTVNSPNPVNHEALQLAIRDGEKTNADILLATDPDASRLGVMAKNSEGKYELLSGCQTGALMLHFLLNELFKRETLPLDGMMLRTVVSSEFGKNIARMFGLSTRETLPGFKNIAEKVEDLYKMNKYTFLFGYDEKNGYLIHDFVRDKDAIQSALLVAEMAAAYKERGLTLHDVLNELYDRHGYYKESMHTINLSDKDESAKINEVMKRLRNNPLSEINNARVIQVEDYLKQRYTNLITDNFGMIHLPKANMIKYNLTNGSWFCIRPLASEEKCEIYFGVKGESQEDSERRLEELEKEVLGLVEVDEEVVT